MKQANETINTQKRKWYTMTELRELADTQLDELVKSFGCSEENLPNMDHAAKLVYVMNNQFDLREKGINFKNR